MQQLRPFSVLAAAAALGRLRRHRLIARTGRRPRGGTTRSRWPRQGHRSAARSALNRDADFVDHLPDASEDRGAEDRVGYLITADFLLVRVGQRRVYVPVELYGTARALFFGREVEVTYDRLGLVRAVTVGGISAYERSANRAALHRYDLDAKGAAAGRASRCRSPPR